MEVYHWKSKTLVKLERLFCIVEGPRRNKSEKAESIRSKRKQSKGNKRIQGTKIIVVSTQRIFKRHKETIGSVLKPKRLERWRLKRGQKGFKLIIDPQKERIAQTDRKEAGLWTWYLSVPTDGIKIFHVIEITWTI